MQLQLTEEQELIQHAARAFAKERIAPRAHDIDREWVYMHEFDPDRESEEDYDDDRCRHPGQ